MIDVTRRLPSTSATDRIRSTAVRWIPGLREDAPKRNLVLLIAYVELLLFGLALLQQAV